MNSLEQHIKNLNSKARQKAEAEGYMLLGLTVSDPEHWAEYGVYTPEQFDRYMLEAAWCDAYKSAHGIRPRGINVSDMSDDDLKERIQDCFSVIEDNFAEERAKQDEFEKRISETIELGAGDRETAIRWILDEVKDEIYDPNDMAGNACFILGVDYRYAPEFESVLKRL